MTQPIADHLLLHAATRRQWRAWLRRHHKTRTEIWPVYSKKQTGRPRIAYNDAVEEALCFGWIDSTVRAVDDGALRVRLWRQREALPVSTICAQSILRPR